MIEKATKAKQDKSKEMFIGHFIALHFTIEIKVYSVETLENQLSRLAC